MKGSYTFRILYEKNSNARYISHLDFVRVLNRAIRRSTLPVTYTIGFNPHPVMTVAAPIPVGTTSEYECMDMDFDENVGADTVKNRFNEILPDGIRFIDCRLTGEKTIPFKNIDMSEYIADCELEAGCSVNIKDFLSNEEIIVDKKSKSGIKQVNIKPDIYDMELISFSDNHAKIRILLPCGNTYNIKPELAIGAMEKYTDNFKAECILPHRVCLYANGEKIY